ncbi:cytochrome b-245 chaperone 1-like [Tachypleus tridentatus]|uniref:cytochrome b-245 chaperone 1-like n=1 Tax=Tachypleus tridentatus TaxID=6853 RepID=UPI003FD61E61
MTRLSVKFKSHDRIYLSKVPGIRSWSILVGILSLGIGAGYYGSDHFILKTGYILGCLVIGLSFLEAWEKCDFDKTKGNVVLEKSSVFHKLLWPFVNPPRTVLSIEDLLDIRVGQGPANSSQVELVLKSGITLPLTDTPTTETISELECLADLLRSFLKIGQVENLKYQYCDDDISFFDSSSSSNGASDMEQNNLEDEHEPQVTWAVREQVATVNLARET